MNDSSNYTWSFDYSLPSTDNKSAGPEDKFAFDLCFEHPLPENLVLTRSQRTGKQAILKANVLFVLRHCREFKTIENHVQHISSEFTELRLKQDEIRQVLLTTKNAGLLISHQKIVNELGTPAAETSSKDIPTICITTCDRPDSLQRLLFSIQAHSDTNESSLCIVIDDSRIEKNRSQNEAIVQKISHSLPFKIIYFGSSQQKHLKNALTTLLPDLSHEIDFLIADYSSRSTITPGRSRNLALLLSVGKRVLILDDDILCNALSPPYLESGIEISNNAREADFFENKNDWPKQPPKETGNPLSLHLRHLGTPLNELLAQLAEQEQQLVQQGISCTRVLEGINAQSRVLISACGTFGDPGTASCEWMYYSAKATRERFYSDETKYRQTQLNQNLWLGRSTYHLDSDAVLMSPITGLDNRHLLPPFFPTHGNEDYLFGKMTQFLHPESLVLDLPWAVPHLPLKQRKRNLQEKQFHVNPGFLRLTGDFVRNNKEAPLSSDASSRLKILTYLFVNLAATPKKPLNHALKQQITEIRATRYSSLFQALKESPNAPDYWKKDIKQGIATYQSSLTDQEDLKIPDGPNGAINGVLLDYMTTSWRQFGKALLAWPQIREAAATIIDQGFLE